MASDYQAIRRNNEQRYGTEIGRIGTMLLADRYDDRTHFIFELLQNAEDALSRRPDWRGSRAVSFRLTEATLRVEHFGLPFDEADVRGICGIAESTKGLTAIGRFGIGFKSVYAVTRRPEVHSGAEAFAIENFVWPAAVPPTDRHPDATVILIPLETSEPGDYLELAGGLGRLDRAALLFLRQIEEIQWSVDGGRSGLFLRESREVGTDVRRVTVIGQEHGQPDINEEWLIFSRAVSTVNGRHAGYVELAFSLGVDRDSQQERITRIERSPLVVFFPTVVETHLGFLVQGPYRTTPSRDNVPRGEEWNQHLVRETSAVLGQALYWLRDNGFLDTTALRCLPLDPARFGDASMFAPLYGAAKTALSHHALLPRFDTGHVSAANARLGRAQALRELLTPAQLGMLFNDEAELVWLSGDITHERTPELRRYLTQELDIPEPTSEAVVTRLDRRFLEAQADDWIVRLYEFLDGLPGLRKRYEDLPLIRLEDGTHVPANLDGQPRAFLPGPIASGFPLARAAICKSETALEFLRSMGLTQPDPVDDVVRNVLPNYQKGEIDVSDEDYEADISRILHAFDTDSKSQREKLLTALRETAFVMAVDAGKNSKRFSKSGDVYLATERLKELFAGVAGVMLVDDSYSCLKGKDVYDLLEACGVARGLAPESVKCELTSTELRVLRTKVGYEAKTSDEPPKDHTLRGLTELLTFLPTLDVEERRKRTKLLWEALKEVDQRLRSGAFSGSYSWSYYQPRSARFDAEFVRRLNTTDWVPDAEGVLQRPEFIVFESLGWEENPVLTSKIRFKPPILNQLAEEAGIEPGLLDLLKKQGITNETQLRELLGLEEEPPEDCEDPGDINDALKKLGINGTPSQALPNPAGDVSASAAGGGAIQGDGVGSGGDREPGSRTHSRENSGTGDAGNGVPDGSRTNGSKGRQPFISYVAARPDDEERYQDGLDQEARMALETKAIEFILSREPEWRRTSTHNPGFDLFKADTNGQPVSWCEVKAMSGGFNNRSVGLSHTQFDCARQHGDAYWLYIVEHANTDLIRVVRIQNPAGKASTFTFDHGWLKVAEVDNIPNDQQD
jgi:hypothetical protein